MKQALTVELFYAGAWHDVSVVRHVYTRETVRITRGRPDQATRTPPASCTLALRNPDGLYTIRNRRSPLFGLIGRNTPIRVTNNGSIRFVGEIEAWPVRWNVTGNDVWAPITAHGRSYRLNAPGTTVPARSALHRLVVLEFIPPLAFWTMATPAALDLGAADMRVADITGASAPDLSWQTAAVSSAIGDGFTTSGRDIYVRPRHPIILDTDVATDSVLVAKPTGNTSSFTLSNRVGGTFFVNVVCSWVTGVPTMTLTSNSGTLDTAAQADATAVWDQGPHTFRVALVQNGANVDVTVTMDGADIMTGSEASTVLASTAKFLPGLISANRADVTWSHVAVWSGSSPNTADVHSAAEGWLGEEAADRMNAILDDEGIAFTIVPAASNASALVGIQRPVPVAQVLLDAADVDGGILYDTRDELGLSYRTHASLLNQDPVAELDYAAGGEVAPPLDPVPDTDATVNDVTVTRFDGASATYVRTSGPLNVDEPPDGVGRYERDVTLVLAADAQAYQHAAWMVHIGTWDAERYPVVNLDLGRMHLNGRTALMEAAAALDCGDRFTIASPPAFLGDEPITLLAQGFTEEIESHAWRIKINAEPEGPWQVGVLDDPARGRLDCRGSTLASAITATSTSLSITITDTCLWSTTAEPYDVVIDGDVFTVTAAAGASSPQTLTVLRSAGARAHDAGAEVHIRNPFRLARTKGTA